MSIHFNLVTILPIVLLNCSPSSFEDPDSEKSKQWDHEKFKTACINIHNFLRVVHNAAPLKWDDTLEEASQAWAQHLNTVQKMEHYEGPMEIGTNIYASLNPKDIDLLCLYAIAYWYKEIESYDFDNPKFASNTGHFTAMVWRATEKFGLGEEGQADGQFYVVASYDPRGNMEGGFEENVHKPRKIPSSCIAKISSQEHYGLLMEYLKVDPKDNRFVYPSDETCILPTRDNPKDQKPSGTSGTQTGTSSKEPTGGQKTPGTSGTMVGTTGTEMGKTGLTQGALMKSPNEIVAVPVSEPVAATHTTPEIIIGQPEHVPQNVPNVIVMPAIQLQPAKERLPVAPGENSVKPQTTTRLSAQVTSTTTVPLNTTVHPSSSSVTPTVSIFHSTISKQTIT